MKVEYSADGKTAYFDGYKFRKDAKTGYYLASKPTYMGHRERLHVYVWRKHYGPIPTGYHVHHVDEDKGHNDIENLRCIPGETHCQYHSREYVATSYDAICKNLIENVVPKAAEWHKSAAGKEWHKANYSKSLGTIQPKEHICEYCGKPYMSKMGNGSKFCSNNCKTAARRKSGVDDETRRCAVCGKEFRCNKYQPNKYCSHECAVKFRRDKGYQTSGTRAGI